MPHIGCSDSYFDVEYLGERAIDLPKSETIQELYCSYWHYAVTAEAIALPRARARAFTRAVKRQRQAFTVLAHPADLRGRHPTHECVIWNVPSDHGPGGYERMRPYRNSADDCAVRSECRATTYPGHPVLMLSRYFGSRIVHVGR